MKSRAMLVLRRGFAERGHMVKASGAVSKIRARGSAPAASRGSESRPTARGAQRALDIFATFARERRPLSISELARMLSIPTSTCHGLVKTLEQCGYLAEIKRTRGYYPTSLLLRFASDIARYDPIPAFMGPLLAEIREETRETVVLGKRVRNKAVYLEVLESAEWLRYIAKVGDTRPLHATAVGKALLSTMSEEERLDIVSRIPYEPLTARTLTSPEKLLKSVEEGRQRGWYLSDGEYHADICAISVPIAVHGDQYCVIVSGPRDRIKRNLEHIGQALKGLKLRVEGSAL